MHIHEQQIYEISNAATRPLTTALIQRQSHRIATLGHNRIIQDYHKTNFLSTGQVERVTKLLPRKKPSLISRIIRLFTNKKP